MAKWKEPMSDDHGKIRIVNYVVDSVDMGGGKTAMSIRHRIEQNWRGQWVPVLVYQDDGAGSLTEIPQ